MNKIYVTELGLLNAIYESIATEIKPGRLKNKFEKLKKITDQKLSMLSIDMVRDLPKAKMAIDTFGTVTGWDKKGKHAATIVSFAIDMIDRS